MMSQFCVNQFELAVLTSDRLNQFRVASVLPQKTNAFEEALVLSSAKPFPNCAATSASP